MLQDRPYQPRAIDDMRDAVLRGHRRILCVAPCRSGKTVIAVRMILAGLARGKRSLFIAHRRGLVDQATDKLLRFGAPPDDVGVLMGNHHRTNRAARIQIASIQTLDRREYPPADLIFFDECHRALAPAFTRVAAAYPDAVLVGLTATPCRVDGRGLGEIFEAMVQAVQPSELVAQGHLLEPTVWSVPADREPDRAGVRVRDGDYVPEDAAAAMMAGSLMGDVVEHWGRRARGLPTILFASSVEHSKALVSRFRAAGVTAEHLDAETPGPVRDAAQRRFAARELSIICNVGLYLEGWDSAECEAVVMARLTMSTALWVQAGCRASTPGREGKAPVVLDHAGCARRHGLPVEDREWSLEARARKRRDAEQELLSVRQCPRCYVMLRASLRVCPSCGAGKEAGEGGRRPPEEQRGELVRVGGGEQASGPERRREWEHLCLEAAQRGHRPGWVWHRYRAIFGVAPPNQWGTRRRVEELRGARMAR